jgi:hypothetical protein
MPRQNETGAAVAAPRNLFGVSMSFWEGRQGIRAQCLVAICSFLYNPRMHCVLDWKSNLSDF